MKKILRFLLIIILIMFITSVVSLFQSSISEATTLTDISHQLHLLQLQLLQQEGNNTSCHMFIRTLHIGSRGQDVKALEKMLNKDVYTQLAQFGPGSPGKETMYFGRLMQNAVKKFQVRYSAEILKPFGIRRATGFVGVATRAKLNNLCSTSSIRPNLKPIPQPPIISQSVNNQVIIPLTVSCNPTNVLTSVSQPVVWIATATGGTGQYVYGWSGSDNLSGNSQSDPISYSTTGIKNASVSVTSGNQIITAQCIQSVTVNPMPPITPNIPVTPIQQPLSVTCSPSTGSGHTNDSIAWSAITSGGSPPYTFSWSGTDNLSGTSQIISMPYINVGQKTATVTVSSSDSQHATQSCTSSVSITQIGDINGDGIVDYKDLALLGQALGSKTGDANYNNNADLNHDGLIDSADMAVLSAHLASTPSGDQPTYALSWSSSDKTYKHVKQFYWLTQSNISDIQSAKMALDALPTGSRYIFLWDLVAGTIDTNPADAIDPATGQSNWCHNPTSGTNMYCLWFDHGVQTVQNKLDTFFKNYAAAGGKLDGVVLDDENGMENWSLGVYDAWGGQGTTTLNVGNYSVIKNDSRFASIKTQLLQAGFPAQDDLSKVADFRNSNDDLIWNDVMLKREAQYLTQSVLTPAQRYFPNVKLSNFGYQYDSSVYPVRDSGGVETYLGGNGAHVGTDQSPVIYGIAGNNRYYALDGVHAYAVTPFNAMRYEVNNIRTAKLSNPAVPLLPWVGFRGYTSLGLGVANTDYYQEMVFHTLLSGIDQIQYFNPYPWLSSQNPADFANANDNLVMENLLDQFDAIAGNQQKQALFNSLIPWGTDYVLTGAQVGQIKIWRFTPDFTNGGSIANDIIQSQGQVSAFSATTKIQFQQAAVYTPVQSLSTNGVWIIQNAQAPMPLISSR